MNKRMKIWRKTGLKLADPALLHFILPILMLYLMAGTIAQKYIGLYEATQKFFSSWLFWLGPIPLPGLPIFMGLLFFSLIAKLILKSPWSYKQSGTIITHMGALLLIAGGLLTATLSTEGYMDLAVEETKNFSADYHARALVLLNEKGNEIAVFGLKDLHQGQTINVSGLPLEIKILQSCRNCKIEARTDATDEYVGMAKHMKLVDAKPRDRNEENMSGLLLQVKGTENNGIYVVLEDVPKLPTLKMAEGEYTLILRKLRRPIPFHVTLLDFKRDMHPGTLTAKNYESRVRITDGDAQWESYIRMNEPLRYKGYTFFQSSFIDTPEGDISVLAVVWNAGRAFPYISGLAICLGLIVHLFARRRRHA